MCMVKGMGVLDLSADRHARFVTNLFPWGDGARQKGFLNLGEFSKREVSGYEPG